MVAFGKSPLAIDSNYVHRIKNKRLLITIKRLLITTKRLYNKRERYIFSSKCIYF